ncbi:unnamed protein product [Closterium sp. Naga37s-1]|nr:unnamed protein product [Closterium sp. Naga37s-1]
MRSARLTEVPARADSLKGWTDLRLAAQVNYRHGSSSHQVLVSPSLSSTAKTPPPPSPARLLFRTSTSLRLLLIVPLAFYPLLATLSLTRAEAVPCVVHARCSTFCCVRPHQVCFTAPVPGPYLLSLHLLFTNAFQLRSNRSPAFNHGYAGYEQVFARVIRVVAPPTYYPLALRALLPWCTAALLRTHGNEGYWLQHKWMPHACRLRTVTPIDALSCFHRHKNVLIMGDSEMRIFFGFLTHFLVNRTRGTYLRSMGGDLQAFHGLQSLPKTTNYTDGSGELLRTPVPFPPPLFTFYGGLHNGFTRQQFNVSMRGRTYLFNLTYASHMGAEHEVLPAWMYNTSLTGGEVVSRPDTPFRLAAYSSSLHDLITLDTAQDYARVARSHLLPSLRRLLQDPRRVTVFGPWAAREDSKPPGLLFKSDNVRGLAFEQEAARPSRFQPLPTSTLRKVGRWRSLLLFLSLCFISPCAFPLPLHPLLCSPVYPPLPPHTVAPSPSSPAGAVLAEVQREWGVSWSQWGEGGDCSQAQGLACDAQGRIVSMYLPYARLLGPIPPAIGRLTALTMLDLSSNSLGGSLPSSLGLLHSLAYLDVSDNNLNGSLPASLSALSLLSHLNMSFNSHYMGDSNGISESHLSPLLRLSSLSVLDLSYNQMGGPFLSSLHLLPNLHHLNLRWNQFLGPLPSNLTALVNLTFLDISLNMLSGSIPASIAQLSLLNTLKLRGMSLFRSALEGSIPASLFSLSRLTALDLSDNALSGSIPDDISKLSQLKQLRLGWNVLHGPVPTAVGRLLLLEELDLSAAPRVNQSASQDRLTGSIPSSLGLLSRLTSLEMASNDLEGSVPESMWNLKALVKLDLSSNHLSGSLSPALGTLPFLHTLLLNNNSLHGDLPASLGGLRQLDMLDVSYNPLSGVIPPALGTLPNLLTLSIWPSSESPGPVCPSPASCPVSPLPLAVFCSLCPRYCASCAPSAGPLLNTPSASFESPAPPLDSMSPALAYPPASSPALTDDYSFDPNEQPVSNPLAPASPAQSPPAPTFQVNLPPALYSSPPPPPAALATTPSSLSSRPPLTPTSTPGSLLGSAPTTASSPPTASVTLPSPVLHTALAPRSPDIPVPPKLSRGLTAPPSSPPPVFPAAFAAPTLSQIPAAAPMPAVTVAKTTDSAVSAPPTAAALYGKAASGPVAGTKITCVVAGGALLLLLAL